MKSIQCARIIVVAGARDRQKLAARLRRMDISQVFEVGRIEQAQDICAAGGADICLVVLNRDFYTQFSCPVDEAPDQDGGIPSLLLADILTPYVCKVARAQGYRAVMATATAPRLLYRRICAAMQRSRSPRRRRRHLEAARLPRPGIFGKLPLEIGKTTLH